MPPRDIIVPGIYLIAGDTFNIPDAILDEVIIADRIIELSQKLLGDDIGEEFVIFGVSLHWIDNHTRVLKQYIRTLVRPTSEVHAATDLTRMPEGVGVSIIAEVKTIK